MAHAKPNKSQPGRRERHISVRGIRRERPDLRKLSRALLDLAIAQNEAEAEAEIRRQREESDHE